MASRHRPARDTDRVNAPNPTRLSTDVLVVGAGPAGSAAAIHLARAGRDVLLVDASAFPRDKTCGDGLTPRAIAELDTLGMTPYLADRPRIEGLRLHGWGATAEIPWPGDGRFPNWGSAVPRMEFDDALRREAMSVGARMITGAKATAVSRERGAVTAVTLRTATGTLEVRPRALLVADGVRSPLGKILGRDWHRDTAYGIAGRAYATSDNADSPWMGSHLELRDEAGEPLPGYGWVFPLGNGVVNLGVGALATSKRPAHVALRPVLDAYASLVGEEWALTAAPVRHASALLPMGGAVSGVAGRNWMLIGDAAACVNPLNGEGIDYALETARMAAALVDEPDLTQIWPQTLRSHYGTAFSAARRLAGLLTLPHTVAALGRVGLRSPALMAMVVRVMGNLITPEDSDLLARAWRTVGAASTRLDSRPPFD